MIMCTGNISEKYICSDGNVHISVYLYLRDLHLILKQTVDFSNGLLQNRRTRDDFDDNE